MYLAIDGYGANYNHLTSSQFIYRFLNEYPESIGMNKITEPLIHSYRGPVLEDWGLSGFVIIAESHISIHTFPERRYLNIDVFSCKEFDVDRACGQLLRLFKIKSFKSWTLKRGLDHLDEETVNSNLFLDRETVKSRL